MSTKEDFLDPDFSGAPRPNFASKSSEAFEYMCLDLARSHYRDVRSGDLHELRGQAQQGVDFLIDRGEVGLVAGSCRSDADPERGRIVGAAKEFAASWDELWKPQGVTRFVLCVACEARKDTRKAHIREVHEIINGLGIACEVWSQGELIDRFRTQPSLVVQHLDRNWVHVLCAPDPSGGTEADRLHAEAMEARIKAYEASHTPLIVSRIDTLQALVRKGARTDALAGAKALRADRNLWQLTGPEQKAIVTRIEAICTPDLPLDALEMAYNEAAGLHSPQDRYFELTIVSRRDGANAALEAMGEPRTARERILKAALMLESDHAPEGVLTLLDSAPPDPGNTAWFYRLRAMCLLRLNRQAEAVTAAEQAVTVAPDELLAQQVRAKVCFAVSLSPVIGLPGPDWPMPYPTSCARQDAGAKASRARARVLFDALVQASPERSEREEAWMWSFVACLDDPDRYRQAQGMIETAHQQNHLHPGYIIWCLTRNVPIDAGTAEAWLKDRLAMDQSDILAVNMLLNLYRDQGNGPAMHAALETHETLLRSHDADFYEAFVTIAERVEAGEDNDEYDATGLPDEEIVARFTDQGRPAAFRLEYARLLGDRNIWEPLEAARSFLLDEIGTVMSFQLAVEAVSNTGDPTGALALFESRVAEFCDAPYPDRLQAVRINLLAGVGRMGEALTLAEQLLTDPSDPAFLGRARLQFSLGNPRGAGLIIGKALQADNPAVALPIEKMRWAHALKSGDPHTAVRLMEEAFMADPRAAVRGGAAFLAMELTPGKADPYVRQMHEVALAEPDAALRMGGIEEAKELMIAAIERDRRTMEAYERGDVFGHAVLGDRMALHYLTPAVSGLSFGETTPKPVHAGSTGREVPDFDTLCLDTSAILVAEALGLWDRLETAGMQLILPLGWAEAFHLMEDRARPSQRDYEQARRYLVECVGKGRIRRVRQRPASSLSICFDGEQAGPADYGVSELCDELMAEWDERGVRVHIQDGVAESMAQAGWIARLTGKDRLTLTNGQFANLQHAIRADRNGRGTSERLAALRGKLSRDIRDGRIFVASAGGTGEEEETLNAIDQVLRSALTYRGEGRIALWVDDRFINGHSKSHHMPILSIVQVLRSLRGRGAIDETVCRDAICKLRQLGYDYILPDAEEIVRLLKDALNGHDGAEEGLEQARRAFERFAAHQEYVFAASSGQAATERQAAFGQYLLASHVIRIILRNSLGSFDEDRDAIVWTVQHLRLDWRESLEADSARNLCHMWHGSLVLSFLSEAATLKAPRRAEAAEILETVYTGLILPAIDALDGGIDALSERIADVVRTHINEPGEGPHDRAIAAELARRFLDLCPDEIREHVASDPAIAGKLGIGRAIEAGGMIFLSEDFWSAADRMVKGAHEAQLRSEGGERATLRRTETGQLDLVTTSTHIARLLPDAVGAEEAEVRRTAFNCLLDTLGMAAADKQAFRRRFGQARSSERRAALFDEARASPEGLLWTLSQLDTGDKLALSQLECPGPDSFLAWLGIEGEVRTADEAIANLAARLGMEEALVRWSGVPVAFGQAVTDWFTALPDVQARETAGRLLLRCQDPVALRNLLVLFGARGDLGEAAGEVEAVISDETSETRRAQLSFARTVCVRLYAVRRDTVGDQQAWLCAWAWTGRVFSTLLPRHADFGQISTMFAENTAIERIGLRALLRSDDILDPNVTHEVQFLAALGGLWRVHATVPPDEEANARLAAEISHEGEGVYPHPGIVAASGHPNAWASWLGADPRWAGDILTGQDSFMAELVKGRKAFLRCTFRQPCLNLFALHVAGVPDLSEKRIERLMREAGTWIPHLDETRLRILARVLTQVRPRLKRNQARRVRLLSRLIARWSSLSEGSKDRSSDLVFILELAARSELRANRKDNSALLHLIRTLSLNTDIKLRDEVARFVRILADCVPIRERAPFHALAARLSGSPYPIGERN
ncbi:hypothetical protein [Henriciella sp.]|uniref:hypothetical protein n=1 Tax=Henriciella sp. TaxID=1968823 RepID=UPI002623AEB4|nr:hypothetical protein [Henriciella sp.]